MATGSDRDAVAAQDSSWFFLRLLALGSLQDKSVAPSKLTEKEVGSGPGIGTLPTRCVASPHVDRKDRFTASIGVGTGIAHSRRIKHP
jgi:hypothetical protein